MKQANVNFYCYQPAPAWKSLPALEQHVHQALSDARGFYRTSGMTADDAWRRMTSLIDGVTLTLTKKRRARLIAALAALVEVGAAVKVGADRWRIA